MLKLVYDYKLQYGGTKRFVLGISDDIFGGADLHDDNISINYSQINEQLSRI